MKLLRHLLLSAVWMAALVAVAASVSADTETLDLSYWDSGSGSWDGSYDTNSGVDDSSDDSFDPESGVHESDDDSDVVTDSVDSSDELTGPAFGETTPEGKPELKGLIEALPPVQVPPHLPVPGVFKPVEPDDIPRSPGHSDEKPNLRKL